MKDSLKSLLEALEYLGGARDESPDGKGPALSSRFWGIWWCVLVVIILFYSGQSSKFIYIDF